MKAFRREFAVAIAAGQNVIRVNTDEVPDALAAMQDSCNKNRWELLAWDKTDGMRQLVPRQKTAAHGVEPGENLKSVSHKLLAAIQSLLDQPEKLRKADDPVNIILAMRHAHLGLEQSENRENLISVINTFTEASKDKSQHLILMMPPDVKLPPEIEPLFYPVDHDLPDEEELRGFIDTIVDTNPDAAAKASTPTEEEKASACRCARGLTRRQAESLFAASIVKHKKLLPAYIWEQKAKLLNKEGLVELYQGSDRFSDLGGLEGAKKLLTGLLDYSDGDFDPIARAKGAALIGGPGTGKSAMAKALGNECGRPVLALNPGNLMGGIVGETEMRTRRFFQLIRSMSPCIVFVDEVSKTMPKTSNAFHGDGGIGSRMVGSFLTAMNDMTEDVFWLFTENSVEDMHEAFFREERNDLMFLVRAPGPDQRAKIWEIYIKKFFPEILNNKPNPQHVSLRMTRLLPENLAKDSLEAVAAFLMCGNAASRENAFVHIRAGLGEEACTKIRDMLVDDEQWTGAEIRSCCRKARRLKISLAESAKLIRPVFKTAAEKIKKLEQWAEENGCIDADTGKLFERLPKPATTAAETAPTERPRRKVQSLPEAQE